MDAKGLCVPIVVTVLITVMSQLGVSAGEPMKIVAFGDSTTAARGALAVYAKLLQDELPARGVPVEVVNAGVGGNSTEAARARLEKDVLGRSPVLVIIQFGINDSAIDVWKGATTARVPMSRYEENLRHFVQTLKARKAQVILMTPNPMTWTDTLKKMYGKPPYDPEDPDGFNLLLKDYAAVVRKIAQDESLPLVDVYRLFKDYGNVSDLLLDGMHPNEKGHRLIADALLKQIQAGGR